MNWQHNSLLWMQIVNEIVAATGTAFNPRPPTSLGGGCINTALRLEDEQRRFFIKLNHARYTALFAAEAAGLKELQRGGELRVPQPLCYGCVAEQAYLVMEYVELGRPGPEGVVQAGHGLAALHRVRQSRFGWHRDSALGTTRQPNTETSVWTSFWREHRLGFQLQQAATQGYGGRLQTAGQQLLEKLPALLNHAPIPSLLHGDLWGGNLGYDQNGLPVIYDPAVYYGDRETDLAMTELFGGFPPEFYAAYREAWPLDDGYAVRKQLYNLYHVLNHLNLFGGGYLNQAQDMIARLLAVVG